MKKKMVETTEKGIDIRVDVECISREMSYPLGMSNESSDSAWVNEPNESIFSEK